MFFTHFHVEDRDILTHPLHVLAQPCHILADTDSQIPEL